MTRPLTGRAVLLWLLGSFGVVLAVNVYFIVISVATFRGEDEQLPYLQGVEYNRTLTQRAQQQKLGWNATIAANRLSSGKVRVAVYLRKPGGEPQSHLDIRGELRHPADENRDHALRLREVAAGRYEAELSGVTPGAWDVIVRAAHSGNAPFEADRRLWVP